MNSRLVYASAAYWFIFAILLAGAIMSGSSSMISESMHQLFDAVSVTFAFVSSVMAVRPAPEQLSYGYHRLENVSVIMNAAALIGGAVFSFYIATARFIAGSPVEPGSGLFTSVIALPVLMLTTLFLDRHTHDIAERSVVIHAIADTATLAVVIVTLTILHFYDIVMIDTISAYLITVVFIVTSIPIMKEGMRILLDIAPENIGEIEDALKAESSGVHHVHIWTMCSHMKIATIHVLESGGKSLSELEVERAALEKVMASYGINHTTIQFESDGKTSANAAK